MGGIHCGEIAENLHYLRSGNELGHNYDALVIIVASGTEGTSTGNEIELTSDAGTLREQDFSGLGGRHGLNAGDPEAADGLVS